MTPELFRPLESILNRNIAGSARARALLAQVAGRSFELRLAATPLKLLFVAGDDRISVTTEAAREADAVVEGTPFALARLAIGDPAQSIRAPGTRFAGDAEVAQGFQQLFAAAHPDFEEELSRVTGDVAAHHLANLARAALDFGRRVRDSFSHSVAEYLTEESRDLPTRIEVDEFLAEVDRLRESTDRLEARLAAHERARSSR